ncbi:putative ribonuclease H-like domain-containing protein, partial [Tanacetum coccineum]
VSVPQTTQENGASVTKNSVPVTTEEKINKKNDVKARSLLLMALPNEHLLTFSQYSDAKTLYAAIKTRFGEDLNSKFLRSLPPELNTHVVVWMNKDDIETMSIDDLYNNFKIVEQEVKKFVGASANTQNMAFMTAQSTSSTNNVNTANSDVSTVSTNVNTASFKDSTTTLSDATIYDFLANQPNGFQLVHEDLEQIHDDDLEEIDLKSDTAGYDKSKVECFNCHKMGHFARECRNPKNQDSRPRNHDTWNRNQDSTRKNVNVKETYSKAMLAIDGVGFDWSDMVEEQVQTNITLMAFSDSEVYTNKSCSKTCMRNYESLKKQCDDLLVKLNETEFKAATYKRGLATVEDQLVTYKKNEVLFSEEIVVLKREVGCKDYEISVLKTEYEKVKQEKEGIDFKIAKFDKSVKSLGEMLESQTTDKSKKGLGYNAVSPPHPLIYNRPTQLDLTYSGLDEFKQPEFNRYGPRDTELKTTIDCDKESDNSKENTNDSLEKEQVTNNESSSVESPLKFDKETVIDWKEIFFHTAKNVECVKPKNDEKHVKKIVRPKVVNTARPYRAPVNTVRANRLNAVKPSACWVWRPSGPNGASLVFNRCNYIDAQGRSKSTSRNLMEVMLHLREEHMVEELLVKLPDESQILLRIPREDNMYSFDMKNIVPKENLTCLIAKATFDESMLWHRRLGHINFKNINKLVKENLVRGLPLKHFENDQTCVACLKGKQDRASCKSKVLNPITKPLFMLHMDLFGPTFVSSLMHKKYYLIVTDDYIRFTWVFFLATKDETSEILKTFIKEKENLVDKKVKIIKCDNGTKFKNKVMDEFCKEKGIRRENSVARTPQ